MCCQPIDDSLLLEAVAKQGGYEVVEEAHSWPSIAKALGQRKTDADQFKQRYATHWRQLEGWLLYSKPPRPVEPR